MENTIKITTIIRSKVQTLEIGSRLEATVDSCGRSVGVAGVDLHTSSCFREGRAAPAATTQVLGIVLKSELLNYSLLFLPSKHFCMLTWP